jgi:hypothetical protein
MGAERFDVGDRVMGRVRHEIGRGRVGQWPRPPAAALVEQHDTEPGRIEPPTVASAAPTSRPAMQNHRRLTRRVPDRFPVHLVPVTDAQPTRVVRFDRRKPTVVTPPSHQPSLALAQRLLRAARLRGLPGGRPGWVLADHAVDRLAQQVGVAGVAAVLLDQVEDQPPQAEMVAVPVECDRLVEPARVDRRSVEPSTSGPRRTRGA